MKNILKPVILLLIFCSVLISGLSQKRNRSIRQIAPVVVPDQKPELPMQKEITAFYNVKKYGAKGDSTGIDTDAINKAIDAADAAGGGTVWFSAGDNMSYSIHLRSNITLYLDNGAYLNAARPAYSWR